jgi:hypothetical protein
MGIMEFIIFLIGMAVIFCVGMCSKKHIDI